jgi:hypothetical protein
MASKQYGFHVISNRWPRISEIEDCEGRLVVARIVVSVFLKLIRKMSDAWIVLNFNLV